MAPTGHYKRKMRCLYCGEFFPTRYNIQYNRICSSFKSLIQRVSEVEKKGTSDKKTEVAYKTKMMVSIQGFASSPTSQNAKQYQ